MKIPRVFRPEFEIEYKGALGFLCAVFCICRIGVMKTTLDITFLGYPCGKHKCLIIPKYTFKRRGDLPP